MAARRRSRPVQKRRRVTKQKRVTKKRRRVAKKTKKKTTSRKRATMKRARRTRKKTPAKKNSRPTRKKTPAKKKSRRTRKKTAPRRTRKKRTSKKNNKQQAEEKKQAATQQQEQATASQEQEVRDEAEGSLSAEIVAAQSEEQSEEVKPLDADLTSTEIAEKQPEKDAETGSEDVVSVSVETNAGLPSISEEAALEMSAVIMASPALPKKRKGGRPKGSKDKKKRKAGSGRPKGSKDGKKRKAQDPSVRKKRAKKQKTDDSYSGEADEGSYETTYETSALDQISIHNEEQKVESISENHDTVEVLKQFVATSDAELLGGALV